MIIANIIAYIIVIIGGLTWGLVGIFNFNLVEAIFGVYPSIATIIVYILVLISTLWLIISPIMTHGKYYLCSKDNERVK